MAQFDVYRLGEHLVIDCQSNLLGQLGSRLVVPLVPRDQAPQAAQRLNPSFAIGADDHIMLTQAASAVPVRELGEFVTSLADRSFEITGALDVLITGV